MSMKYPLVFASWLIRERERKPQFMSIPRGIAPVRLDKSKLQLCTRCKQGTLPAGSDMLKSCNGCSRSLFRQLHYCRPCATQKSCCQVCTDSLIKAQPTAVQQKESPVAAAAPKKKRALKKISLIKFMECEAEKSSQSWEDYLADYASTVTEGAGAREKKDEKATIRISRSPRIDTDERRQVNSVLSDNGYGQQTRDITIGEIYLLAKAAAKENNQ